MLQFRKGSKALLLRNELLVFHVPQHLIRAAADVEHGRTGTDRCPEETDGHIFFAELIGAGDAFRPDVLLRFFTHFCKKMLAIGAVVRRTLRE